MKTKSNKSSSKVVAQKPLRTQLMAAHIHETVTLKGLRVTVVVRGYQFRDFRNSHVKLYDAVIDESNPVQRSALIHAEAEFILAAFKTAYREAALEIVHAENVTHEFLTAEQVHKAYMTAVKAMPYPDLSNLR